MDAGNPLEEIVHERSSGYQYTDRDFWSNCVWLSLKQGMGNEGMGNGE